MDEKDREEKWLEDHVKFCGDARLRNKLVFQKGSEIRCVYCGKPANTKEHVPSKTLVSGLGNINLPVLPACSKCNNSFSDDESYVKDYIDALYEWHIKGRLPAQDNTNKGNRKEALYEARRLVETGGGLQSERVKRILAKIAKGHAAYELSELCEEDYGRRLSEEYYTVNGLVEKKQWESLMAPVFLGDKVFPEVGSRAYTDIWIIDSPRGIDVGKSMVLDWRDIKEGIYSYNAYHDVDGSIVTRILIKDFLYARIRFGKTKKGHIF